VRKWHQMHTVPSDQVLELGRWNKSFSANQDYEWNTTFAVAKRSKQSWFFPTKQKLTWDGENYTHWRLPPAPPQEADQ